MLLIPPFGKQRWADLSLKPAWFTEPVPGYQGSTEKPCLEKQTKTKTTKTEPKP